jgi:hypothetical protein
MIIEDRFMLWFTLLSFSSLGFGLFASNQATQNLTINIHSSNELSVSGNVNFNILDVDAQEGGILVDDKSTTLSLTSNSLSPRKVTVSMTATPPLPQDIDLMLDVDLAGKFSQGGTIPISQGVKLNSSPSDLITNLSRIQVTTAPLQYTLKAPVSTGPVNTVINVTFLLTS